MREMEGGEVLKAQLDALCCFICRRTLTEPTTIKECLHTFCKKCIYQRVKDGVESEDNSCPECNIQLGHHPKEKLRPDKLLTEVLEKLDIGLSNEGAEDNEEDELFQETINEFCNGAAAAAADTYKQLKAGARGHVNAVVKKMESMERQLYLLKRNMGKALEHLEAGLSDMHEESPALQTLVESLKFMYAAEKIANEKSAPGPSEQKVGKGKRKRISGNGVAVADEDDACDEREGSHREKPLETSKQGARCTKKRLRPVEEDSGGHEFNELSVNARGDGGRVAGKVEGIRKEKRLLELDAVSNEDNTLRKDHPTRAPGRVQAQMAACKAVVGTAVSFGVEVLRKSGKAQPVIGRPPLVRGSYGCGPPHAPVGWGWMVGMRRKGNNHRDVYFWPPGISEHPVRTMRGLRQYFAETIPGLTEDNVKALVTEFTRRFWSCPWQRGTMGGGDAGGSGGEGSDAGSDDEGTPNVVAVRKRADKRSGHAGDTEDGMFGGAAAAHHHAQRTASPTFSGQPTGSEPSPRVLIDLETAPDSSLPKKSAPTLSGHHGPHSVAEKESHENVAAGASDSVHSDGDRLRSSGSHGATQLLHEQQQLPGRVRGRGESSHVGYDFVSPALQSGRTSLIRQSYTHNLYANLAHRAAEALDLPDAETVSPASAAPHLQQSAAAAAKSPAGGEGNNNNYLGEPQSSLSPSPTTTSRSNSQGVAAGPLRGGAVQTSSLGNNSSKAVASADVETAGGSGGRGGRQDLMWLGARDAHEAGRHGPPQTDELLPSPSARSNFGAAGGGQAFPVARARWSPPPRLDAVEGQQQQQQAAADAARGSQPAVSPPYTSQMSPGKRGERSSHYQPLGGGSGEGGTSSSPLALWGAGKDDGPSNHGKGGGDRMSFHAQPSLGGSQDGTKQAVRERPATQPVTLFGSVISAGAQTSTTSAKAAAGQGLSSGGSQGNLAPESKMPTAGPSLARAPSPSPRAPAETNTRSSVSPEKNRPSQPQRVSISPEVKKGPSAADVVRKHFSEAICRSQ